MFKTKRLRRRYNLTSDLSRIKDAVTDTAFDIKDKAQDVFTQSLENTRAGINSFTAHKPFKAIGFSVIAGFILGFLFRR